MQDTLLTTSKINFRLCTLQCKVEGFHLFSSSEPNSQFQHKIPSNSGYCTQFRIYSGQNVGDQSFPALEAVVTKLIAVFPEGTTCV